MSACTCASLNQRSTFSYPLATLHSLCEDAPEERPEGAMRGGSLHLEQHAWAPHGPLERSSQPCPLPLPLPAPLAASPSAASHGPSAKRPASQLGTGAPRTRTVRVRNQGTPGAHFLIEPQNH